MPIYTVEGPDGHEYKIEGPEGATDAQLISVAQNEARKRKSEALQQRAKESRAALEAWRPEQTVGGNVKEFFKGIVPGGISLLETAGTGIASLLPEDTEKAAREKIKEIAGIAKSPFAAEEGYENSIGRQLGEGTGSFLPFVPLGPLGMAGRATGVGIGLAAGAGEARERAEEAGATTGQRSAATAAGTIPGGLDAVVDMTLSVFPGGASKAIGFIKRALISGGVEGGTEAAQQVMQNAIAKGVYDPKQDLVEGSGEQGAYGAGVGVITSLLLDMAMPGRHRGPTPKITGEEEKKAPPSEPQGLLGYDQKPFTPVTAPDGSVITTQAEYDAYLAGKQQESQDRETDRRTSDPLAGLSEFDRELARSGKQAALAETFGSQEPDLLGDILPAREEATTPSAEEPAPERDTQTRDMIAEDEEAQIKEMVAKDDQAKTEAAQAKLDSDLETLQGQIDSRKQKTESDERMGLLLPIVEAGIENPLQAFKAALRKIGKPAKLTTRENLLLQHAEDVRIAIENQRKGQKLAEAKEAKLLATPLKSSSPEENAGMEALIPEKKTTREPQQVGIEGVGKRTAAPKAQVQEEEKAIPTVLTPEVLDNTGLPRQSGFYRQLLNVDMADPANHQKVGEVLARVRENPHLSSDTKSAIERIATQAFTGIAKQQDLFAETSNVSTPTPRTRTERITGRSGKNAGANAGRTGTRAEPSSRSDAGGKTATGAASTEASKQSGVGATGKPADHSGDRKAGKPAPLKEAKKETKPEAKKETKPEAKPEGKGKVTSMVERREEQLDAEEDARDAAEYEQDAKNARQKLRDKYDRQIKSLWPVIEKAKKVLRDTDYSGSLHAGAVEFYIQDLESTIGMYESLLKGDDFNSPRTAFERTMSEYLPRSLTELQSAIDGLTALPRSRKSAPKKKAAPKAKKETKAEEPSSNNPAWEMLQRAEQAQRDADEKAKKEAESASKPESKSESKPSGQSASTQDQTKQARRNYLEWAGNRATAVRFLAGDVFVAYGGLDVADQNRMLGQLANGEIPKPVFGAPTKQGTGGVYAKRFFESLTEEEKAAYADELEFWLRRDEGTAMVMADMNAYQNRIRAEEQQFSDEEIDKLSKDLTAFSTPLNVEVLRHIQNGDVLSALAAVGKMGLGRASQIAKGLAGFITNTQIEVADFSSANAPKLIKDLIAAGELKPTDSGFFTTRKSDGRRLIMLNSKNGLDVWSLLHEATHAAMHDTLNNPNHPITKQLQKLFEGVKAQIKGTYGAKDLGEFLSEARSNPEFQKLLNGITPDGKPISAWRRYLNIVGNFMRRLLRMEQKAANTSVLSTVDALIDSVIAGKGGAAVSLDSIAMLNKGASFMDGLAAGAAKLPYMNQQRVGKIMNIVEGVLPKGVKNIVLGGLPLNALTDIARGRIPMADRLNVLDQQKSGADNRRHEQLEPVVKFANEWQAKNPKSVEKFNRVVYTSTRFRVDPSKDRSKYLNSNGRPKFDTSGNNLAEVWDSLQADWRSLKDNGGQDLYRQMRDSYKSQYEDMKKVLLNRIDGMETDEGTKQTLKNKFLEKLFEGGTIEPYFPLTRKGDYWLSYDANGEHYVEAFESDYERRKAIEQLGKKASNVSTFSKPEQLRYRELPPTTFVGSVLQALEAGKVDREVIDRFMEQFINILPETSFMKNLRHREGTLGFEQDAVGAFRNKAYGLAHQVTNIEYGQKFSALQNDINKYVKSQGSNATDVLLLDELNKRIKFAMSPNIPQWSKVLTSVGFNMTLGANVSSAMVNMAQIPLVVMPYLGGKYGLSETTKAIGRASRYFLGSGSSRMIERVVPGPKGEKKVKVKAFPSLDNYDFSAKGAPKHLEALSEYAKDHGQLNRSMMYDILDVGDADSVLSKINAVTGFVFHHSERMNRQVSMIAAYELELQRLVGAGRDFTKASKEQQQAAAKYAVETTELTNGAVAATAAPRFAQSGIGKVVFMYKRYGAAMYYLMAKTARDALGSKPEGVSQKEWAIVQAAAKRQLAGIFASSALLAGAQGLPMYGIVAMIYNLILKATGNDDEDDFDTAAQKYLGAGIHSGAINALTGTEWASRIGLSDLLFRDTMTKPNQGMLAAMLEQFGGPMVGIANRWERGYQLISDGHVERGMEQMLPSAVGNVLKGIRLAEEGAKTVRGDTVVEDLGAFPIMAQFFGFAPAEYVRQLDINAAGKQIERAAKDKKDKALKQYYIAMRNGDSDGMADAWEQISEYNQKHPTAPITMDSIQKSIRRHERTSMEMYHGVSFDKRLRTEIMQNLSEFEED